MVPHVTEGHILAVLAGVSLEDLASQIPAAPADLAEAVESYKSAGRAALEARSACASWHQVRIQFADWEKAEQFAAASLGPGLREAQEAGTLTSWWFLRKHPYWRLRCRAGPATTFAAMKTAVEIILERLVASGAVICWRESFYEPETLAFGGAQGMDVAHDLFHADSRGVLNFLTRPDIGVGRRELSIMLCTGMFRGARRDEHEQGDIWHRVELLRPLRWPVPAETQRSLIPDLRRLMSTDSSPSSRLFSGEGPLGFAAPWSAAFADAGHRLADAATGGTMQRGLRAVLAHHVIFHWNRLGLPASAQAVLAHAATETILGPHGPRADQAN